MTEMPVTRGRRDSIIGGFMARKYANKNHAVPEEDDDSTFKRVSNRDLIHGVASSFFEAAYQRLKSSKASDGITIDEDYDQFAQFVPSESSDGFWKDENFRQEYELGSELGSSQTSEPEKMAEKPKSERARGTQEHFIDILLDKMISTILPENFPEREHFSQRLNDPDRKRRQKLSATVLASNLKILTTKLGSIFELQDSVIRLVAWRNPSGTITMLIMVTMICFNPIYLAVIPLLYVLYGLMVPGYMHRHPPRRTNFLSRKQYGRSLIVSLTSGGKRTHNYLNEDIREYDYNLEADPQDVKKAHNIKQSMEFVVNLRDLQNSMSAMVSLSNSIERFVYGTAGFKDEHRSTVLFLAGLGALLLSGIISPFINWSALLAALAWLSMVAIHPKVRPKLAQVVKKEQLDRGKEALKRTERYDVILDEQPEVRVIEIFEIFKKEALSNNWSFVKYSSSVFDPRDSFRKAQVLPPGVDELECVCPPLTWSFDANSVWEIDYNVGGWSTERCLNLQIDDQFLVDDAFKRRRLTRKVLRYASPARKPSYK